MIFNCPICGNILKNKRCSKCEYKYNEIISYSPNESYKYNEFDIEELRKFNLILRETGSLEKSLEVFTEKKRWILKYAIKTSRSYWIAFFKQYIGDIALDIGCGFGNNTRILTHFSKEVYGIDITTERLETLSLLSSQINLAQGNIFDVNVKENSVDTALLIGVLEWLGCSNKGKVTEIQIKALKLINNWLKSDGYLIFAIENRVGLPYFAGAKDHEGTRFTSLMPRKVANLYKKIIYKKPYCTFTYTSYVYRKILKNAGFNFCEFYLTFPNYRYPEIICSYKDSQELKSFVYKKYNTFKGKMFSILVTSFLSPSFFIIASKSPIPKNKNKVFLVKNENSYIKSNNYIKKIDFSGHD